MTPPPPPTPIRGGPKRLLVQTASLYFLGTVEADFPDAYILREVIVITNTGRLDQLLKEGKPSPTFAGFEAPPGQVFRVKKDAEIWSTPWVMPLFRVPEYRAERMPTVEEARAEPFGLSHSGLIPSRNSSTKGKPEQGDAKP